jgi:predicted nuclease of predicted toxin-antitoxin system
MNFIADEGVDFPIVTRLRQDGHVVWYIAEMSPSISDEEVLQLARAQQAVLVTFDKDFGELVFRQGQVSSGIVLLRLHGLTPQDKAALFSETIRAHGVELSNSFTVVTPTKLRIRPFGM